MIGLLLLTVFGTVFTDFPGGSVGGVQWAAEDHLQIAVEGQSDQDGRNRQANWYYFRIDGVENRELTVELMDLLGEYNYRAGTHAVNRHTHPVYSYDNQTWTHFSEVEWDEEAKRLRMRFTPEQRRVWIAHTPPYTEHQLSALEDVVRHHPNVLRENVGFTLEKREIPLWTISDPSVAASEKKTVWLMFRQHAWESWSSWVGDGAIRYLLSDDPEAAELRRQVMWKIFPLADPDGVHHGAVRFNRKGYDLNRNWDAIDPKNTPEIAAQHAAIQRWLQQGNRIDLFLSLHNTETDEYLEGPAKHRELVDRFREILKRESTFNPTRKKPRDQPDTTTPGKKGRMTVNQGLFADFGIPAMLMEQMVAYNEKLRSLPTVEQRQQFGRDLVRAAAKAVRE